MERTLFSKLSLYDQIGYFFVGSVLILLIALDLFLLNSFEILPDINSSNIIVYLIVAYFMGHIIQSLANIFIKEKKSSFDSFELKILNDAKTFFKVKSLNPTQTDIFQLCYIFALGKDKTAHLVQFNALYSFYRGVFLIFSLETLFLIVLVSLNWFSIIYFCILLLSILISILMFFRLKRFALYFKKKVFYIYLLNKTSS